MTRNGRRIWLVTLGVLAAGLSVVAVAWACTPTADMSTFPSAGAPGTQITVTGRGFAAGRVEIRMDSTTSAPVATATGPSFSVTLTLPEASTGYHIFGAVGYDADGLAVGETSSTFRVTGTAPAAPVTTAAPAAAKPAAPAAKATPTAAKRPVGTAPSQPAARRQAGRPERSAPAARASRPPATAPALSASTAPVTVAAPTTAAAPRPQVSTPVALTRAERRGLTRRADGPRWTHAHARSIAAHRPADLWQPAPSSAGDNSTGSAGPGTQIAIGIGLLALGLVALFGGFAVAEVRRRRAPAAASGRRRR